MTEIKTKLLDLFNEGKEKLFQNEIDNILVGINERNLCGRLSTYFEILLEKYGLSEYYSDPEYNRRQNGEIKTILDHEMNVVKINCDVIFTAEEIILEMTIYWLSK